VRVRAFVEGEVQTGLRARECLGHIMEKELHVKVIEPLATIIFSFPFSYVFIFKFSVA
jgi:hypothetical protein